MIGLIKKRTVENLLSVKVWCIFIATGLLCFNFLTGMEYSIVLSTILAAREVFKVSKIKWGNENDDTPV
jgi:hypothetical protein